MERYFIATTLLFLGTPMNAIAGPFDSHLDEAVAPK